MIAAAPKPARWLRRQEDEFDPNGPADDGNPFGMSEAEITHEVDVADYVAKRNAIAATAARSPTPSFFLKMPRRCSPGFGRSGSSSPAATPPMHPGWLFDIPG